MSLSEVSPARPLFVFFFFVDVASSAPVTIM
jgi:hypothetical protein